MKKFLLLLGIFLVTACAESSKEKTIADSLEIIADTTPQVEQVENKIDTFQTPDLKLFGDLRGHVKFAVTISIEAEQNGDDYIPSEDGMGRVIDNIAFTQSGMIKRYGNFSFYYDNNDNFVRGIYGKSKDFERKAFLKRDNNGYIKNIENEAFFDCDDMHLKHTYYWDNGKLLSHSRGAHEYGEQWHYKYKDDFVYQIDSESSDEVGVEKTTIKYKYYEYDNSENWIKRIAQVISKYYEHCDDEANAQVTIKYYIEYRDIVYW